MATDLWLYFVAVLAVIVLPGMDMAFVLASSLSAGPRGAAGSVLGIATGGALHVVAGGTGIAALMTVFPQLFHVLLSIGTLYLLWIGWHIFRSAGAPVQNAADLTRGVVSTGVIYRRAVATCLLNPKAYAFMFAIFPAFVHSDARSMAAQTAALVFITVATQIAVYGAVAALAVRSRAFLVARQRTLSRTMGVLLMLAALAAATQAWSSPQQAGTPSNAATASNNAAPLPARPAMTSASATPANESGHGRNDFDFFEGDWHVENRKLRNAMKEDSGWETFSAEVRMEKLPGGFGNFDIGKAPDWRPGWMGMTLRIFNPETHLWSLFWLNTKTGGLDSATGQFMPPVVGKFENGVGIFEGDDVIDGTPLRVRYTWYDIGPDQAKWMQAFSFDGGRTWKPNWYMTETRRRKRED